MNTTCNYRCSYCTQRFVDDRKQWAKDLPAFVAAFTALSGDWEIKLSGGEPFRHPRFLETVEQLVAGGLRVSVVTNFSDKPERLQAFAALTSGRPGIVSASLHLEYVDVDEFVQRASSFARVHAGSFCVTCVATRDALPRLPDLKARFDAVGVRFKVQPEKQDREVIDYDDAERRELIALGGHNSTGRIAPSFTGRPCWAGARYVIVDHRGAAWRCYPSRRHRKEPMGNVLDGTFRLRLGPEPCRYAYCNCTVPQERRMVNTADAGELRPAFA
jgi:organic radical activating enzyme